LFTTVDVVNDAATFRDHELIDVVCHKIEGLCGPVQVETPLASCGRLDALERLEAPSWLTAVCFSTHSHRGVQVQSTEK
jgi:hypothetical protein